MRAAGLSDKAAALEEEATALQKRAEAAPAPGHRLDLLEAFIARAEGRASKAADLRLTGFPMASRAYSIPNLLTYGRILAVPVIVLCFYVEGKLESSDGRIDALAE